jgi:hypothetical protein
MADVFHGMREIGDPEHAILELNKRRKLKLALVLGSMIVVVLAALLFAQLSSSPGVPYGY